MELAPKLTGLSTARLERITDHLERNYLAPGKIAGCQVAVSRHGHLAYFRSFGQMDRQRGKAMADDAIFRIYSMTKPITSVALMMLYERGYFQLNDPVHRFVPEWRDQRVWISGEGSAMVTQKPKRPVSMRDMLCHTGGLTYGSALAPPRAPHSGHPLGKGDARTAARPPAHDRTDASQSLEGEPGPDSNGDRRLLGDGERRRRIWSRLRLHARQRDIGQHRRQRLVLGRRCVHDLLGGCQRRSRRRLHDAVDAVRRVQLPRPAQEHRLFVDCGVGALTSPCRHAAVDDEFGSGYVTRIIAREIEHA